MSIRHGNSLEMSYSLKGKLVKNPKIQKDLGKKICLERVIVSAITGKVEKSYRLSSYLGAEKQNFPTSGGEPGADSNSGMGSGPY